MVSPQRPLRQRLLQLQHVIEFEAVYNGGEVYRHYLLHVYPSLAAQKPAASESCISHPASLAICSSVVVPSLSACFLSFFFFFFSFQVLFPVATKV